MLISKSVTAYDRQWWMVIAALVIADAIMIWAGLTLAYTVRIQWLDYNGPVELNTFSYSMLSLISIPLFLLLFRVHGLYNRDYLLGGIDEYRLILRSLFDSIILMILTSFIFRDSFRDISRGWLLTSLVFTWFFVTVARFALRQFFGQLRRRGWLMARVLIVGANDQGVAVANLWRKSTISGMNVIGFVDDFKPIGSSVVNSIKVIGRPTSLAKLVQDTGAHEVIVVPSGIAWETYEEIIATAALPKDYTLRLSTGFYEMLANGVTVTNNTTTPLLTINEARLVGIDAMLKRIFDVGLLVLTAPITVPLAALVGLSLKLMGKPVFARHQTVGERGKVFEMLKFNTCFNSHWGSLSQIGDAPLVTMDGKATPLEKFLYHTGMDKLPQLWNIARDQMSWVGPRPRVVGSSHIDVRTMPNLQAVKPGLIGPWSVSQEFPAPKDELLDEMSYVRHWTIWLDIQIVIITLLSIFKISKSVRPPVSD
jgi:lipopolysaccharide/colanic/teichoic acid biosynthesis glycosyltransferase